MGKIKNVPLVLYGAGVTAKFVYNKLVSEGITPACFVDSNKHKQHKEPFRGCNLKTYSIDEVKKLFPVFQIYVTTFSSVKYEIFDFLVNKCSINKDDIINYSPYVTRISCKFLESHFKVSHYNVKYCTHSRDKTNVPVIKRNELDRDSDTIEKFLRLREETIASLQAGTADYCNGCSYLKEMCCSEKYYISDLVSGTCRDSLCNFKCIYCYRKRKSQTSVKPIVSSYFHDISMELEDRGLISPEFTTITLTDGELTIRPDKSELFTLISRYNSQIFTNASTYSQEIEDLLNNSMTRILVSVDCGTRTTFNKIKGVDAYEAVRHNLVKYGKTNGSIVLKYIFLPGINDNAEDLSGFINLCKEANISHVRLSLDYYHNYNLNENGLFNNIMAFAARLREESFFVDATGMSAFMKPEYDAIMGVM